MSEINFKVLLISYFFPPWRLSGSVRTLKFVKYLLRNNWKSTVITSNLTDLYYYDESLQKELNELDIEIIRIEEKSFLEFFYRFDPIRRPRKSVRKIINYFSNFFFVLDFKIQWAKQVKRKVIELLKKEHFDVILISCPPFSVFSELTKIKSSIRIPIVVDYRDLWFGSHYINYPTPLHRLKHKKLEYKALKVAQEVIVSNRKIKEKLIQIFPFLTFESVTIIDNGFDPDDFTSVKSHPRTKNKMVLLHYGEFNSYSSAKYFLKAFYQIKLERPDIASNIELHFVGDIGKENKRLVKNLNLHEFIHHHNFVSYKESIYKILAADVVWLQIDNVKNYDVIVPSKLFYYFAARKPIIGFISDGATKMLLDNYDVAFVCKPDNINEIKATTIKVYELYKNNLLPVVSEQNIEKFREDLLIETLLKILQSQVKII